MNPNAPLDWVATTIVLVAFPTLWCTACYVISIVGGWRQLAKRYRRAGPISGTVWRFQSAAMYRLAESSYGGCLTVAANEEGLGLSVFFPFRVGSPPLFIPWSEMLVSEVRDSFSSDEFVSHFPTNRPSGSKSGPRLAAKIQKAIELDFFRKRANQPTAPSQGPNRRSESCVMVGAIEFALGLLIWAAILWDGFATIVLPRTVAPSRRLSGKFNRWSWRLWSGIARRIVQNDLRLSFLSVYGPISVMLLLVLWAGLMIVAFA